MDDEPIVCDSIRMLLEFEGHSVVTANRADEAGELFDPGQFDVLVTDYAMPGAQGTELACQLRQRAPQLHVILVTAYAEMLQAWGADLSGVDSVICKPFRLEALRKALAAVPPSRHAS